ncbi:MAG: class I SAM-dependent methyltransferase [Calditrichaceae bacterium]
MKQITNLRETQEDIMREMWNQRYSGNEYVYGEEPNEFFRSFIDSNKPGSILLPGEGEGRNAVYAARKGWDVSAFDFSENAVKKARLLAEKNSVNFEYHNIVFEKFEPPENRFDAIGLIYVHLPSEQRPKFFRNLISSLKPGGKIVMEVFSKTQLLNDTGGPKTEDLLYDFDELRRAFKSMELEKLVEQIVELHEGKFHGGMADIIRMIATKK